MGRRREDAANPCPGGGTRGGITQPVRDRPRSAARRVHQPVLLLVGVGATIAYAASNAEQVTGDGETHLTRTHATDVATVLDRLGIEVTDADRVDPAMSQRLDDPATITVQRVRLHETTIDLPIEHGEQRTETVDLPVGETWVQREGREGLRREVYEITFVDGEEVGRQPLRAGELDALRATTGLPAAAPGRGVTVDKTCQVVYHRDAGRWQDVHPASTGAGGLPRVGTYQVQWMRAGWHTSTLYPAVQPNMYNTLYFHGAIAIHGSHHVPPHPASAGCVRVTPPTADRGLGVRRARGPPTIRSCARRGWNPRVPRA